MKFRNRPTIKANMNVESPVSAIAQGADPWVVRHEGRYVWCASIGDSRIAIWEEGELTSLGLPRVVWSADSSGPVSAQVWAPELHHIGERWYIYFSASDGHNENHLAYVLVSVSDDPGGPYELVGPLRTGAELDAEPLWAIDMTTGEIAGRRYAVWSGWEDASSDNQWLYIAEMSSPTRLSSNRVRLCPNDDHPWEFTGEEFGRDRGLNEAPQFVPDTDRTLLTYSGGASWRPTYCIGALELVGDDPLDPGHWAKHPSPLLASDQEIVGPGHACFVRSPDDELWMATHYKVSPSDGWERAVTLYRVTVPPAGPPLQIIGRLGRGERPTQPSGESPGLPVTELHLSLRDDSSIAALAYYGHRQAIVRDDAGIRLGSLPAAPVDFYPTGEKLLVRGRRYTDLELSVDIVLPQDGSRDAGVLFRVTEPSLGYDAQCGYYAGVLPGDNRVVLGRTDGFSWLELTSATLSKPLTPALRLGVTAVGVQLVVKIDGRSVLAVRDAEYTHGGVGMRAVNTETLFSNFEVVPR